MLRLTLAQMRRSIGRLVAAGVAITIGTAFVAATLLAGGVMTRSTYDTVTARYAQADLVVTTTVDDTQLAAIRAASGVDAADPVPLVGAELSNGGARVWVHAAPIATDPRLDAQVVSAGVLPSAPGQIALPVAVAQRLDVGVGDHVVTPQPVLATSPDPSGTTGTADVQATVEETLTVVGLLDDPHHAYAQLGGAAALTAADAARWGGSGSLTGLDGPVLVALAPGTDLSAVRAAIRAAAPAAEVSTRDEAAKAQIAELSSETEVLTGIVLGFAAVALVVAALVIANTFQVLVAQRTRTLALLRCVGADRGQLRRSVLAEAAILGAAASLVGLALGIALAQGALMVLGRMDLGVPLPTTVTVTGWVVLVPLVLGTAVTLLAALVPARAATRVAPIEALRPSDAPAMGERAGRVRLVIAAVLTVGGVAGLLAGVPLTTAGQPMLGLAVAVLGGAVSFIGVLVGAVFWVPRVVALVGRGLARTGTSARLAAANTARNPRRTAATSSALLIGVTLVALMSAGAASTRVTLDKDLDSRYPVDLALETTAVDGSIDAMPSDVAPTISDVAGIAQVTELHVTAARISTAAHPADAVGSIHLRSISPADLAAVVRTTDLPSALDDHSIVLGDRLATSLGVRSGDRVDVAAYTGFDDDSAPAPGGEVATLTVAVGGSEGWAALVTTATGQVVAPAAPVAELWVRLADVDDAGSVVPRVQDAITTAAVSVDGPALQRASYQTLISTLLAVVVGLLAVAVIIALVGVANTLSLSVLERRRESATLRAIGLSRRQLRWMLAIEGMLIAGIGAVLGTGLGLLYGWAGAATVLSTVGPVTLAVPWRDVGIVLVVAVAAGLAASVVPGRAAARTSPVAALAVD